MNNQVKFAILAIVVVIPLSSYVVWASDSSLQLHENDNSKIHVISSFYPLYEFTKKIGQDKVDVTILVPVGVEPHDWEPTIQDVQKLQQADLIVINGIGFEEWIHDLESMTDYGVIVDTSFGIDVGKSLEHNDEHNHAEGDPHIWLNPVMAQKQVQNISNALSEIDPQNSDYYQTNAQSYIHELELLDSKIRNELTSCKKDFISFHNAFSYFANEYDLHQHTIISSNDPHSEATSRTLENVINFAREFQLDVIFTEEAVDSRTSQVIANEIGGKVLVLSPLEIGNKKDSYVIRMEQNLENLKEALC